MAIIIDGAGVNVLRYLSTNIWNDYLKMMRIQKKKTVTEKVYIFTEKDCDP
jgi:hypothetical protein